MVVALSNCSRMAVELRSNRRRIEVEPCDLIWNLPITGGKELGVRNLRLRGAPYALRTHCTIAAARPSSNYAGRSRPWQSNGIWRRGTPAAPGSRAALALRHTHTHRLRRTAYYWVWITQPPALKRRRQRGMIMHDRKIRNHYKNEQAGVTVGGVSLYS